MLQSHSRGLSILFFLCLLNFFYLTLPIAVADEDKADEAHFTNEQLLNQMLIVDASEQTLHNAPALAVTFSQALRSTDNFDSFITVTENGKLLKGGWILADKPRRLYFTQIKPDTRYRIQIRPGVTSENGLKLQRPGDFEIKTRDIQPAFDFATRGSILPAKLTNGLPVRVVNVPEVDVEFLRVTPDKLPEVLQSMRLQHSVSSWQLNKINALTTSVYSARYTTNAGRNARETRTLPIETVPALQKPGLYFAVMRRPGHFTDDAYRITHFIVTNIGLHARLYSKKLKVFAHALDSGAPLPNVKLILKAKEETLEAHSDEAGQADFKFRPKGPLLLTAQLGDQFAFLDLRQPALDLSEYPVTGRADRQLAPFIYAPRDLYRPGEKIDLSVILRDRDGMPTPVQQLNMRLVRPDTKVLQEETLPAKNAKLGYFSQRFQIPDDAPTGVWRAEVRIANQDKTPAQTFSFNVEEFMPERMKLVLSTEKAILYKGERLVVAAQGDYLYGSPAAGNELKATRVLTLEPHPLEQLPNFHFGNPADKKRLNREALKPLKLDEKGGAFIKLPPLSEAIGSPLNIQVIANLKEPGGRVVTRTLDEAYWPAQRLIGVAPAFSEGRVEQDSQARFEVIRTNAEGELLAAPQLAATLVKVDREYFWEYNDQEGWTRQETKNEYPISQQKFALQANEKGQLAFPVKYGDYRLEIEDPETGLKTVYPFFAGWSAGNTQSQRPDQIELKLDKPAYKTGDTIQLEILPSEAGQAIVTVEGDGLLWSENVELTTTGTTVSIPVKKDWARHDLYIAVTAFRPASTDKKITPNRALGIVHLPLDRSERRLDLVINAPDKTRPEQSLKIQVQSTQLQGREALLTLAAVDVGVLNITNFQTPDPWSYYFSRHKYGVDLYDDYGKIIENTEADALYQRFGGGSSKRAGGAQARAKVQIVSLFKDQIVFDEQGNAEVELFIPGFDGQLRLMAIAMDKARMGSTEKNLQVASPVVANIAGPRFLATGDSSFITVELNNVSDRQQELKLGINANLLLDFTKVEQTLSLDSGQRKILKLPVSANDNFGVGNIHLRLEGADFIANRNLHMAVRPAYPAQRKARYIELAPQTETTLSKTLLDGLLAPTLQGQLTISNTPALPVATALKNLMQYPYGCLEQTTSSAYPYLFLEASDTERWGLKPMTMAQRNEQVQAAIMRLAGMQLSDGGFTLWGSYGPTEYWLTPYVTNFLLDAKQQGFTVPETMLQRAQANLSKHLRDGYRRPTARYSFSDAPNHLDFAARAFAAYVLARANTRSNNSEVSLGTLRNMLKEGNKAVTGLPWVHLGLALTLQGDASEGKQAIKTGLSMQRTGEKYLGDYGSPIRDRAMMLYLLMRHKQTIPKLGVQVGELANNIRQRQYLSTQEKVFIFLLGQQLEEQASGGWQANLNINGQAQTLSESGSFVTNLTAESFRQNLQITSAHDQPLYVSLELQAYPEQAPEPRSQPIAIQRQWFKLDGSKINARDIQLGDLLLTRLSIKTEQVINDALVVDLLPSAFEIENTNLVNNDTLQTVKLADMNNTVVDAIASIEKKTEEFLDDRYLAALRLRPGASYQLFYLVRVVSAGTTTIPPAYIEDMYRPDISGIDESPGMILIQ